MSILDTRRSTRNARGFREFMTFTAKFAATVLCTALLLRGCS